MNECQYIVAYKIATRAMNSMDGVMCLCTVVVFMCAKYIHKYIYKYMEGLNIILRVFQKRELSTSSRRRYFNWTLLTDFDFIVFATSNLLACISCIVPYVYLPDLSQVEVGLDARQSAVLILICGISNTLVRVLMGLIADLPCANRLVLFSTNLVVCGLASCFVTYYNDFVLLAVYAAVFSVGTGQPTDVVSTSSVVFTFHRATLCIARTMLSQDVCLSVHPSVLLSMETAERIIKLLCRRVATPF